MPRSGWRCSMRRESEPGLSFSVLHRCEELQKHISEFPACFQMLANMVKTPVHELRTTIRGRTLMIEQLPDFPDNVLAFVCKGRVTKADYDAVLVPAVVHALTKHAKVRLYYETAADFAGMDPGA